MHVDFVDVLKIQYVKKSQPGVRYYQWRPSNSLNTGSSSRYLLNGPGQRRQSVTFYQAASYFNVFSPGSRLSLDQALLLGADLSWPWVVRRVGDVYGWRWMESTLQYSEKRRRLLVALYKKKAIIAVYSEYCLLYSKHCQAWFPCMSGWMLMWWPPERFYYVKEFFISQGRPFVTLSHWHITKPGPGLQGDRVRWRHRHLAQKSITMSVQAAAKRPTTFVKCSRMLNYKTEIFSNNLHFFNLLFVVFNNLHMFHLNILSSR